MARQHVRAYTAEALGTAGMVLAGCGAIVAAGHGAPIGGLGIALAFGTGVALMILLFGRTSGAHLNPAVTLGLVVDRRLGVRDAVVYIVAQTLGALGAAALLWPYAATPAALGVTLPRPGLPMPALLAIEVLLTAVLMATILLVVRHPRLPAWAGAGAIGAAVALGAALGGAWTGASMNPARSLGPALVTADPGLILGQWPYLVAPALGALLALAVVRLTLDAARARQRDRTARPTPEERP